MKQMIKSMKPALLFLLWMTIICGILYTATVTGFAQLIFPQKANGSMIELNKGNEQSRILGSELIAQPFTSSEYLIGRPMEVSQLSPTSEEQKALVEERVKWWREFDPENTTEIPAELVLASASGVDPHISPEAAEFQVERIARERNIKPDSVRAIISRYTQSRLIGFVGEETVNVLKVNLALDGLL